MTGQDWPSDRRAVLHVDANAFFVACHRAEDPGLAGRPVVVAGDPRRRHGIVLSPSYEARRYGIVTTMLLNEARRRCPQLVVIAPDHELYEQYARRMRAVLADVTPKVEPFSIDEAFLDVTGSRELLGPPEVIARALMERLGHELGLPVSVGVSENKLLAKMASDLEKPLGLVRLLREDVPARLWPLPVGRLLGVGPRQAAGLAARGIRTIGELAAADPGRIPGGERLVRRARGEDDEPVTVPRPGDARRLSVETTLASDAKDLESAAAELWRLAEELARRLRAAGYRAGGVGVKVRYAGGKAATRETRLATTTVLGAEIGRVAQALLQSIWRGPVRLVGVEAYALQYEASARAAELFPDDASVRAERLQRTLDALERKYGRGVVKSGRLMSSGEDSFGPRRRT